MQSAKVSYNTQTGETSITGVSSGTYYLSIKYDPSILVGFAPAGTPTVTYLFQTSINGVLQPASGATMNLVKK